VKLFNCAVRRLFLHTFSQAAKIGQAGCEG
jgi:hypothetical protein